MGFAKAVCTCYAKMLSFEGRARMAEYWWFALYQTLALIILFLLLGTLTPWEVSEAPLDKNLASADVTGWVLAVGLFAIFFPSLALTVRRLHDIDKSGWWYFICLVPFGGIVLFVFMCMPGTPGRNRFGPSPVKSAHPALRELDAGERQAVAAAHKTEISDYYRRNVLGQQGDA